MNEKTRNVFEQLQESLANVVEQLINANDALYVVATETMDLSEQVGLLNSKLDKLISAATKVVEPVAEKPAAKPQEVPTFEFKNLRKEMK